MQTKFHFKLLLFIIAGGSFLTSFGQNRSRQYDMAPLLFKNFLDAEIVKKDGSIVTASVNYNTNNQSIIFLTKDEYMELTGLEEIDQIRIDSAIFVPVDGKIYQVTGRNDLFVSYSNKVVVNDVVSSKPGSEVKNARESSNTVSNVYMFRNYEDPNGLAFVKNFWVMQDGELVDVSNIKKLSQLTGVSKDEINDFVKTHRIDFNNYADVTTLLDFLKIGGG